VQLDRFILRTGSSMPSRDEERRMVTTIDQIDDASISQVIELAEIEEVRHLARRVHVSEAVTEYMLDIIGSLRQDPDLAQAPGPRGTIALHKCCRARALLEERDFVIPDDVKHLAAPALGHRLRVKSEAEMEGVTAEMLVKRTLERVAVPKVAV
jgi:MoxR-like ATPase